MLREECSKDKFTFQYTPIEDFTKCYWQKKPGILPAWIAFRVIVLLYYVVVFFWTLSTPEPGHLWYKSLADLNYWNKMLQLVAFGLALEICVEKYLKDKKDRRRKIEEGASPEGDHPSPEEEVTFESELPKTEVMPFHYKVLWCAYTIAAPLTVFITLVFWIFIYDPGQYEEGYRYVTHIFNNVLLILDFFLNAIPYRFLHIYLALVFCTVYVVFTIIYQFSGGTGDLGHVPIYDILDWREPLVALTSFSINLICLAVVHCVFCVLNMVKIWMKRSKEENA